MTTSQSVDSTDDQPDPAPKRRWPARLRSPKLWLAAGLAVAVLIGAGVGSFYLFSPKRSTAASRTRTVEVSQGDQTSTVSLDGTLSPRTQANLNFAVSGEVTKVYVSAGQKVTKGQKLARIDDSSLQDAVDIAQANLTSAQANYSDVASSGSSAAITAASAQVDSAKASLSSAKTAVKDATLRATMSGTIASVDVSVGDQVTGSGSTASGGQAGGTGATASTSTSTTTAQVVLISTSTWKLEGSVGAADLASLKAGQSATVTADGTDYPATLASVGIVATSTSDGAATFPVVVNLTGTQSGLYSGTTASAVITTGTYKDVLTVATAAISTSNGETVVTKVNSDGSTTLTTVAIGRVFGDATEITSGLAAGDTVQISVRPSSSSTSGGGSDGGLLGGGGMGGGMGGGLDSGGPPAGAPAGGPGR